MILSVDNHVLRETFGEEESARILREAGFTGVDYSFHEWPAGDPLYAEDSLSYARKIREALDASGIVCRQCHAPFDFMIGEEPEETSEHYRRILRAIRMAAVLGAQHIALHSIYGETATKETEWSENIRFFRSLIPVCEETGVKIAIENLPLQASDTPEDLNRMIKELDSPWFGVILDTGHAEMSGIRAGDFVRRLDPGILLGLHIQDMADHKDKHWIPYMGEIDWEDFLTALREYGYQGDFSLEIIHFMESVPPELLPAAHRYAAAVGQSLIGKFSDRRGSACCGVSMKTEEKLCIEI